MDVAERTSKLSYAKRLQVGAIIVKDDRIISVGYNGMPSGWDNNCEYEDLEFSDVMFGEPPILVNKGLKTRPEVLHAETNAIAKVSSSTDSSTGATMFCTHAPCLQCAKLIYQSGIKNLFYKTMYREKDGLEFLQKSNVNVTKHN